MKARQIVQLAMLLALLAALGVGCSTTQQAAAPVKAETPASVAFHDIVGVDFVQQYAVYPPPENVVIIDSRPKKAKYDKGHIPTAISIPDTYFDKMSDKLPADKNALLIFYCGGLKCNLSHKSAWKAEKLGYKNVKVFAVGFPAWMKVPGHYAWVSADFVQKQIASKADWALIDSRPKRTKYDKGHIPSAISIPNTQFDKFKGQLPEDLDRLLVFYCGGFKCNLSHKSAAKAIALGHRDVRVFAEGYPAWKALAAASTSVVPATAALKAGKEEGSIDIQEFEKIVREKPDSVLLIDVRDPAEFKTGSFKTAINLPVDELEKKAATLSADKPIVFVCGTGARSGESYYMMQDLRPDLKKVYYLEGELTIKKDGSFIITQPK